MYTLPYNTKRIIQFGSVVLVAMLSAKVNADVICYPDMVGSDVSFENIVESSLETGALYGAPSVAGNKISFPARGFAVQAVNNEVDFINGRVDMTIRAAPGKMIDSLTFEEAGTFFLQGPTAMAISSAVAMVNADGSNLFGDMTQTFSSPGSSGWSDSMTVHFAPTDVVHLVYDSRLFASAGLGEAAFIDKGNISISVGFASSVPEPGSLSMLGGLLFAGMFYRSRQRK